MRHSIFSAKKMNYFLYAFINLQQLSATYWLSHWSILLSLDPEFVHGLRYRFERVKRDERSIEDVYDGSLYQSKCGPGGFLSKEYNLSLKLNTDGVAIFHSSQFGVWPLFFLVNELPPSLRYAFKSEYHVQCRCICILCRSVTTYLFEVIVDLQEVIFSLMFLAPFLKML